MAAPHPKSNPERPHLPLLWRRLEQVTVAAVLGLSGLAIAAGLIARGFHRGQLIDIDRAAERLIQFQLDINTAAWPELTMLPGIGESLARRIVEYRETHGPFATPEDLRQVRGLGPKTLHAIRPYLLPIAAVPAAAEK